MKHFIKLNVSSKNVCEIFHEFFIIHRYVLLRNGNTCNRLKPDFI